MELEKKIGEIENIAQEHILDYKARSKLDKRGYDLRREGKNTIVATKGDDMFRFGHGIKGVYFFSHSNKNKSFNSRIFSGIDGLCDVKVYPTKLEIVKVHLTEGGVVKENKEWHLGHNPIDKVYYPSFSAGYKEVRNKLLECTRPPKK